MNAPLFKLEAKYITFYKIQNINLNDTNLVTLNFSMDQLTLNLLNAAQKS